MCGSGPTRASGYARIAPSCHSVDTPRKLLHEGQGRREGDLLLRGPCGLAVRQSLDITPLHRATVLTAQHVLREDLDREGETRDRAGAGALRRMGFKNPLRRP